MPSPVLDRCSPFQLLHDTLPDLSALRVFGNLCYATTLITGRTKFDPHARKGVFLGHQLHVKGAVVYDVASKQIFVSRHVVHHETIFPYQSPNSSPQCWDLSTNPTTTLPEPDLSSHITDPSPPTDPSPAPIPSTDPSLVSIEPPIVPTDPSTASTDPTAPPPDPPRHSNRLHKPPPRLQDYICNLTTTPCSYPIHHYLSYDHLSPPYKACIASLDAILEPTTYDVASKHPCWVDAMNTELKALEQNHTWSIVEKPAGINPIGCKWVYKVKRKADGSLERYKARLVAKGYTQTEGIDFFDTFSPVAKMATVRTLIAVAAIKDWHIH